MKTFKKLESLGFFDWLAETHNLRDTDMKPEYLDSLPLDDIHRTVVNSMAFRWFREKYEIYYIIEGSKKFGFQHFIYDEKGSYEIKSEEIFKNYEEAELACITKLIEIVEQQKQK